MHDFVLSEISKSRRNVPHHSSDLIFVEWIPTDMRIQRAFNLNFKLKFIYLLGRIPSRNMNNDRHWGHLGADIST